MKLADLVHFAKQAQSVLRTMHKPAEHIYVTGLSEPRSNPSLVFISNGYDKMNIYDRALLSSSIQKGPLRINYHVVGPKQISSSSGPVTREHISRGFKIYGNGPLTLNGTEYPVANEATV